ncbi:MAG: indole-3-glycerol phosphate synthase TrpC [Alphaproteobacteria bacterium]|nr:indole-3-glycerol phosphate synthase TrpC [Alphaproteobacteria bacterium]
MSKLQEICDVKREHVAKHKAITPLSVLEDLAKQQSATRGFHAAIQKKIANGSVALIAEIKKASPSKGVIREDFNPPELANFYELGGATCLSVLTDEPYFQGRDEYLKEAREVVNLPVLRKDFMIDPYQITESRALGADCILLIMAALSDAQAQELEDAAIKLKMDVLVEVHDEEELHRALKLKSKLLGVNNRSLKTLQVDIATSLTLRPLIPEGYTPVCESGIFTRDDIAKMRAADIHCFLIGESLMRQADVLAATHHLLEG